MTTDTPPIATIEKNARERIHVGIREFKGREFLDVRTHYDARDDGYKPTGKGITIPIAKIPELRIAIEQAEAEAMRRGLLTD